MLNVTLDTNCIIDLEENRPNAIYIKELIRFHINKKINLKVIGISASELTKRKTYSSDISEFKEKLNLVSLDNVEILKPIGYWGITFWNWCLWSGDELLKLEKKIHNILFPNIPFELNNTDKNSRLYKKWRNAKCDVQAIWCHIWYKGDIFVTNDQNFLKKTKKEKLIIIGAREILYPKDVVEFLKK